jgi:hypothetical protein
VTLDEYLVLLQRWEATFSRQCTDETYKWLIGESWFRDIAPFKAAEYGIECWVRLGIRALVVDTNACYYRWKQLMSNHQHVANSSVQNALRDSFGYSIMTCTLSETPPEEAPWWGMFQPLSPHGLNDLLISEVWEQGYEKDAPLLTMSLAYNMYRETPKA